MPTSRAVPVPAIKDLLASGGQSFSFEFMPAKSVEDERKLWLAIRQLEPLKPTVAAGAAVPTTAGAVEVAAQAMASPV